MIEKTITYDPDASPEERKHQLAEGVIATMKTMGPLLDMTPSDALQVLINIGISHLMQMCADGKEEEMRKELHGLVEMIIDKSIMHKDGLCPDCQAGTKGHLH